MKKNFGKAAGGLADGFMVRAFLCCAMGFVLAGCGGGGKRSGDQPNPTASPSASASVSPTPVPTPFPGATGTASPLPTPAPSSGPTPKPSQPTPQPVVVTVSPVLASVAPLASQKFVSFVGNTSNLGIVWSLPEGGSGDVTGEGVYTAPLQPGTYHLIVTSLADPTKTATATVYVNNRLTLYPAAIAVTLGDRINFSISAPDLPNPTFAWRIVEGDKGGTITPDGVYIAPQKAGVFHVLVTSNDPTRTAVATVTVQTGGAEGTVQ